jgi:predicted TIM-barrel fold metal-dependent hydrolase
LSKRLWPFTWPHQGAILENNVPFQISNGPQLWLVKLHASLCIDKYHFLDLYGLCNMKKQSQTKTSKLRRCCVHVV